MAFMDSSFGPGDSSPMKNANWEIHKKSDLSQGRFQPRMSVREIERPEVDDEDDSDEVSHGNSPPNIDDEQHPPAKDSESESWSKTREFLCQFLHLNRLDIQVLRESFERETEYNMDFWERFCQNILNKQDILYQIPHIPTLIQLIMGLKERELFAFLDMLLGKFDQDKLYMLTFEEFSAFMESMARRLGFQQTAEYCRYLNKYDFNLGMQKDRFFSTAGSEKNNYFGPFTLRCMFDVLKTDAPMETDKGVDYLTDIWKFQPILLNFWFSIAIRKVFKFREQFYVYQEV
jgi:hypothetical protein